MTADKNIMQFPVKSPYECSTAETYTSCKLPKDLPDWWKEQRKVPFNRFWEQGLPTQKLERFKYTNIARAVSNWDGVLEKSNIQAKNGDNYVRNLVDCLEDNFVKDLVSQNAAGAGKYGDTALYDLNSAYLRDGVCVDIPANKHVDTPIELSDTAQDDCYTSPRVIIRVADNAEVTILDNLNGDGEYWRNRVTQIVLGSNAKLHHIVLNQDSASSISTQFTHITLEQDATYQGFALNTGAAVMRHQIQADLQGQGGHASFDGLNLLKNKQHADTTILIEHQAPHCTSNQFYRNLVDDNAHGVFQGKVHVYQEAQKTDGYQLSNTLLLSDKAQMDTKPELEIYADDVQCSHGATTGQLDEEPLFYLRSRGLPESQARLLLVEAFVEEVVDKIQNLDVRTHVQKDVQLWLLNALS